MAQWNGQFTGNSHATKVNDYEDMLKHAVEVFQISSDEDRGGKSKAVKKLAGKVLNARLKLVKAKEYEAEPVKSEDWAKISSQIEHLRQTEAKLTSEGVNGILLEFGAKELIEVDE